MSIQRKQIIRGQDDLMKHPSVKLGQVITQDFLAGFEITAHHFPFWYRRPRSKKRRTRVKWMKRPENWKNQTGIAYRTGKHLIVSLDAVQAS
jgi:hypothetical protein